MKLVIQLKPTAKMSHVGQLMEHLDGMQTGFYKDDIESVHMIGDNE